MGLWLMALAVCAAGIYLLWQAVGAARDARAAHRWAIVAGRIYESRVERVGVGTTAGYEPYIAYTYEVAGRTYPGEHRGARTPSETVAARALRAWPAGGAVPIHYDPARPARGLVAPPVGPWRVAFGMFCGLLTLGVGLLGLWALS